MAYIGDRGVFLNEKFLLEMMPGIDGEYIKIYIFAKYLSEQNGGKTDLRALCSALSLEEKYAAGALRSLAQAGLIRLGANGTVTCCNIVRGETSIADEKTVYLPGEVGAIIESDEKLSAMLEMAQKILGKLFSYSAIEKLYGLYDWLGMSPELILRLIEYCAELGKKDMRYIEKVAVSWKEMGICSVQSAEEYIKQQNYKRSYSYKVQKALGIENRRLTASEQKYIEAWYAHRISIELIEFAYDYAVSKTGKFAAAYINKVLISWAEAGITTPQQAQKSINQYSDEHSGKKTVAAADEKRTKKLEVYNSGRYNYDEIDALARQKLKRRLGKE